MLFQIPYKPQLCAWSDFSVVREVGVLYRHDRLPQTVLLTVYFQFPLSNTSFIRAVICLLLDISIFMQILMGYLSVHISQTISAHF